MILGMKHFMWKILLDEEGKLIRESIFPIWLCMVSRIKKRPQCHWRYSCLKKSLTLYAFDIRQIEAVKWGCPIDTKKMILSDPLPYSVSCRDKKKIEIKKKREENHPSFYISFSIEMTKRP